METISNRSIFFPDLATSTVPLTPLQKFELSISQSTSPATLLTSGAGSLVEQATETFPGYGQGAQGYGKRLGASLATSTSTYFFGTFLISSALHDDPRYFVNPSKTVRERVGYALLHQVVGRTDSGQAAINWAKILGPLAAESLANVYLPQAERTPGRTFQRYGIDIGWEIGDSLIEEYWPSIFKGLRISKPKQSAQPDPNAGF